MIRWFCLGGELAHMAVWKKTVGYDAESDIIFVPAAIVSNEITVAFLCNMSDTPVVKHEGHYYVPSDFVISHVPERLSQKAVDHVRGILRLKMEVLDVEPV